MKTKFTLSSTEVSQSSTEKILNLCGSLWFSVSLCVIKILKTNYIIDL
jgi:hypothetical protein